MIKNIQWILIVISLSICACTVDRNVEQIISPNGVLVANSMNDLTDDVAKSLEMESFELEIKSISFVQVNEGYFAELMVNFGGNEESVAVFYMSRLIANKLGVTSLENSEIESKSRDKLIPEIGATMTCLCGLDGYYPAANCKAEYLKDGDGNIVSLTCKPFLCFVGCVIDFGN